MTPGTQPVVLRVRFPEGFPASGDRKGNAACLADSTCPGSAASLSSYRGEGAAAPTQLRGVMGQPQPLLLGRPRSAPAPASLPQHPTCLRLLFFLVPPPSGPVSNRGGRTPSLGPQLLASHCPGDALHGSLSPCSCRGPPTRVHGLRPSESRARSFSGATSVPGPLPLGPCPKLQAVPGSPPCSELSCLQLRFVSGATCPAPDSPKPEPRTGFPNGGYKTGNSHKPKFCV